MDASLVESVSIDLKSLSGIEFKKKYSKSKFQMRQVISSQPVARKHFGYAPTGNAKGKWDASTSSGGNPARKDAVSGVKKQLANKQPTAKLHRKGGIGGANFGRGHIADEFQLMFAVALDEYGVSNLNQLAEEDRKEFLSVVETLPQVLDEDGNSYGPFWEDYQQHLTTCANCMDRPGGVRGYVQPVNVLRPKMDQSDLAGHVCAKCGAALHPKDLSPHELQSEEWDVKSTKKDELKPDDKIQPGEKWIGKKKKEEKK